VAREAALGARPARGRTIVRFLVLFGVYVLAGHALLSLPAVDRHFVGRWTELDVRAAAAFSAPFGLASRADGSILAAGATVLEARKGCDGITALLILATTMLAFPAPWPFRLVGLALGALAVFAVNAVRLASLLLVAVHWPDWLDFFHVDVWQPAMVFVAFGLFFLWGTLLARQRAGPPVARDGR
jgi:exosortase/archaeosortase family protein